MTLVDLWVASLRAYKTSVPPAKAGMTSNHRKEVVVTAITVVQTVIRAVQTVPIAVKTVPTAVKTVPTVVLNVIGVGETEIYYQGILIKLNYLLEKHLCTYRLRLCTF